MDNQIQGAVTLKMNLFINTVVYLEMCRKGEEKKKEVELKTNQNK